jgi:hypothetical protein
MKTIFTTLVVFCSLLASAQTTPILFIDNTPIKFQGDISLPYWVGAGKSVQLGQNAVTASILEFTLVNNEMEFSQAIHLTSNGTVPTGKVWKIEAIGIGNNSNYNSINNFSNSNYPSIFNSPITFSTPGTYSWTVPPGVTNICIEAWGGGGRGGPGFQNGQPGGGGGGGGYGYQCFTVSPGTTYNLNVGAGGSTGIGNGGSSTFGTLITVTGGNGGTAGTLTVIGTGGAGGTSTASFNITGSVGGSGTSLNANSGGNGANGGVGGFGPGNTQAVASQGTPQPAIPGGGGGGGSSYNYPNLYSTPANGANGQIKIYF